MSSELRTRLITQMDLHGLAPNTQRGYLMSVKALAAYYKESPEKLTDEQIRAYFHHLLKERKLTKRSCHRYLSGLIFFTGTFASAKSMAALVFHIGVQKRSFPSS